MVSVLSRINRTLTGGSSIGETAGGFLGGLFTGGSPAGVAAGRSIGGAVTGAVDLDKPDVSTAPQSAGIDSAATLTNVSQTSQIPRRQIDIDPRIGQGIGMNQASLGILAPFVTGAGRALTSGAGRNVALGIGGTAIGGALTMFDGSGKKLIITRKMQREVKEMFMFMGGDLDATADAYSNFKGRPYTADNILAIMLKKFSSQGPYVTKAAVRKTRSTLRKMKTLCDMTDDLMPKKRAPVRRRATTSKTTLIRN
jgi:hypothetical protein